MVGSVHGKSLKCLVLSEYYLSVSYDDCYCLCKKCDLQNDLFVSIKDDWVFILFSFVVWRFRCSKVFVHRVWFGQYLEDFVFKCILVCQAPWLQPLFSCVFVPCSYCCFHTALISLTLTGIPVFSWVTERPDECVLLLKVNMRWERKTEKCGTEVFSLLGEGRGRLMVPEGSLRYTWIQVVPKMNQFLWEGWVQKWCGFSRIRGVCNKLECFSTINRTLDLGRIWVHSRICLMVKEKHTHTKRK